MYGCWEHEQDSCYAGSLAVPQKDGYGLVYKPLPSPSYLGTWLRGTKISHSSSSFQQLREVHRLVNGGAGRG